MRGGYILEGIIYIIIAIALFYVSKNIDIIWFLPINALGSNAETAAWIFQMAGALSGVLGLLSFLYGLISSQPKSKIEIKVETRESVYVRCSKCKTKNEEDAEFCKKCGNEL
ncbi:MAG: hypothetical protein Sv326_0495 [Candidatus Fermentimicrarchaeum limneticum]|uniref:Putative zinc-ribbon domain-containing protein n=1 Tax=Fermentimicrarchaeum limneticum TaxID=2795018 RepID=A0A7D5XJI0_FERL1|nr:MAG: hypothetical protein Sv326_0495 [Candidatus Fermentimicrarchaeum limneticum]